MPTVFEKREADCAAADFLRAGVAFIHVPRTAGASVLAAVYKSNTIRHFSLDQLLLVAPSTFPLPRFTIVRNPWDRAVSAYHFAKQGGGSDGLVRVYNPRRYHKPDCSTFDVFVREFLNSRDVWEADPVFKPQGYYVSDRPFDHVGRFEQLGDTEAWLSGVLGREVKFGRSNTSQHSHYRDYYTPETRDIVGHLYRDDVARFGFDF